MSFFKTIKQDFSVKKVMGSAKFQKKKSTSSWVAAEERTEFELTNRGFRVQGLGSRV